MDTAFYCFPVEDLEYAVAWAAIMMNGGYLNVSDYGGGEMVNVRDGSDTLVFCVFQEAGHAVAYGPRRRPGPRRFICRLPMP